MTGTPSAHYRLFGSGPRQLLAVHCTLGHAGSWREVGHALSDLATLTALDLPSHGKSAAWNGTTDLLEACTEAAAPFLRQPTDLIGHSFGAIVALRLALEQPEQVRSLTLIEPVLFAVAKIDEPETLARHLQDAAPYMTALGEGDVVRATRLFNRHWGDGTAWDDFHEGARRYMTDRVHLVAAQGPSLFDDAAGLLAPDRLGKVTMPVLLLQGEDSPDIIRTIHSGLAARLRTVQRASISGARHMLPITHPEAVAAEIADFLKVVNK